MLLILVGSNNYEILMKQKFKKKKIRQHEYDYDYYDVINSFK